MNSEAGSVQPASQKVGRGILILVSALMMLNGVGWFFAGPARTLSYAAETAGLSEEAFNQRYPQLVEGLARNRRQVAVWYAAFGTMALIVSLSGPGEWSRWSWRATWLVPAAPIAIGIVYMPGGRLDAESAVLLAVGGFALLGQLLARPREQR